MEDVRFADTLVIEHGTHRGLRMATLVTGEKLRYAAREQTFIKGGVVQCAEGAKYDLRMGSRILKAGLGHAIDTDKLNELERSHLLVLNPGEMAFALTEETLDLGDDMVATL